MDNKIMTWLTNFFMLIAVFIAIAMLSGAIYWLIDMVTDKKLTTQSSVKESVIKELQTNEIDDLSAIEDNQERKK
jgi:hypothetical protein